MKKRIFHSAHDSLDVIFEDTKITFIRLIHLSSVLTFSVIHDVEIPKSNLSDYVNCIITDCPNLKCPKVRLLACFLLNDFLFLNGPKSYIESIQAKSPGCVWLRLVYVALLLVDVTSNKFFCCILFSVERGRIRP